MLTFIINNNGRYLQLTITIW